MSRPSEAAPKDQRPHRNDEHRACPTTPTSSNANISGYQQNPVQQNVIESTTTFDTPNQPPHHPQHSRYSATTMPPAPSDPEGSIPVDETGGIGVKGGSSSIEKMSTDTTNIRPGKHDTTSRSSLPGYRGSVSTPTSSHTSTSETSMLSPADTPDVSADKPALPSDHGGARRKAHSQTSHTTVSASQQPQTSSHLGILSSHLQPASQTYTTSSGGAVLQTLRDPSHYEELSVIGNGKYRNKISNYDVQSYPNMSLDIQRILYLSGKSVM